MKNYTQAPLPFMGQKRKFLKPFKAQLSGCSPTAIYVDLFGGSGLLSRNVKDEYPGATVIYNDYDNYRQRIDAIPKTNALIAKIRYLVVDCPKDKVLPNEVKTSILEVVKHYDADGFVDYVTLSANLLFSMNYVTSFAALEKETFYNVVRKSDYDAVNYLDGLEVVCMDYKTLFEKYKDVPGVVFLVDPPYLSTEVGTYKGNYWKLGDYLDVLTVLQNQNYFYFTSNKSHIVELCNWMATHSNYENPF
ncbi:MAG: DNA methyltransferase, partial [Pseudopedobacter saltans]